MKLFITFLCFMLLFNACTPGDEVIGSDKNIEYVNTWIKNTMSDYYYWNTKLHLKTDKSLNPNIYFDALLYKYDPVTAPDGDRFSWIVEDYVTLQESLSGVVSNEIGFEMALYYKPNSETDVIGQITYVKKDTPAETSGLQRGMFFDRINDELLTISNYKSLLTFSSDSVSIGLAEPIKDGAGVLSSFASTFSKTIMTVPKYAENPVYLDTIFSESGHKIGYLVYNFFATGSKSDDYSYDLAVNAVFGRFKTETITDMVLDLRYNSGGAVSSARLLASELVPALSNTKLWASRKYNETLNAQFMPEDLKTYFTTNVVNSSNAVLGTVNNVGDQIGGKLYILTGPYTASASEQIINTLKPYMTVVLIGDTTIGKNVASVTIVDTDHTKKNKWGLQPIIAKYFNCLNTSDFTAGFLPDFPVKEGGLFMKAFADREEPLLKVALNEILGNQSGTLIQKRSEMIHTDKLLSVPGKRIRGMQLDILPFYK